MFKRKVSPYNHEYKRLRVGDKVLALSRGKMLPGVIAEVWLTSAVVTFDKPIRFIDTEQFRNEVVSADDIEVFASSTLIQKFGIRRTT